MRAFTKTPAVIASAPARRFVVDLLPGVLADIRNDHRPRASARRQVETEPPRIPPSEAPDFGSRQSRVSGRHDEPGWMRVGHRDVDAQNLPKELVRILRVVVRIAPASAVALRDVEVPVGPECQTAGVVIRIRVSNGVLAGRPHELEALWIGNERIRRPAIPRD